MSTGDHQRSEDASRFADDENALTDDKFNEEIEYIMQDQRLKIKAKQRILELKAQEEARKQEANKRRR